jgi:hypothetical protein
LTLNPASKFLGFKNKTSMLLLLFTTVKTFIQSEMEIQINNSGLQINSAIGSILIIALTVLLSCWCLFYLDHKTTSISVLFTPGNIAALLVYFVPTFSICTILFNWFQGISNIKRPLLFALSVGIPVGFILIIFLLS